MRYSYLNNSNWVDITRDERFFCAHLYFELIKKITPFLQLLSDKKIINADEMGPSLWEVGYEVCFYRDYIHRFHESEKQALLKSKKNPKNTYSPKRTFDLCLFSNNKIIIIEAKSHTGFNTKQLKNFDKDKKNIKSLLGEKCPSIYTVALCPSPDKYNPRPETIKRFNCMIYWKEMYDLYNNDVFLIANKSLKDDA